MTGEEHTRLSPKAGVRRGDTRGPHGHTGGGPGSASPGFSRAPPAAHLPGCHMEAGLLVALQPCTRARPGQEGAGGDPGPRPWGSLLAGPPREVPAPPRRSGASRPQGPGLAALRAHSRVCCPPGGAVCAASGDTVPGAPPCHTPCPVCTTEAPASRRARQALAARAPAPVARRPRGDVCGALRRGLPALASSELTADSAAADDSFRRF